MKKFIIYTILFTIVFVLGIITQHKYRFAEQASMSEKMSESSAEKKPLYWVAPMDPSYRRDKPGNSPMGMDLVPVYAEDNTDEKDIVKISPQVEQNLGVRTITVKRSTLAKRIDTVGYVTADENQIEHIHTYTDGWIRRLLVKTTGEHVEKDQLLLQLYSPTLINAQEEYLLALGSTNKTLIDAAYRKLLSLGVDKKQIQEVKKNKKPKELVSIYATQAGIVSSLHIREGMYVKPEMELMTLEDLSQIWVIGEVYERQASWVQQGQKANADLPYLPGKTWSGIVDYVYPRLDPVTHTLKVRLRFENPNEILKPNMYANITIYTQPVENVLSIPREAVIYTENGARIIVSLGDGRYRAKKIHLGIESGDSVAVLHGLSDGDQVVTSAQFLIDSESSLKASFNRMSEDEKKPSVMHHHH